MTNPKTVADRLMGKTCVDCGNSETLIKSTGLLYCSPDNMKMYLGDRNICRKFSYIRTHKEKPEHDTCQEKSGQ